MEELYCYDITHNNHVLGALINVPKNASMPAGWEKDNHIAYDLYRYFLIVESNDSARNVYNRFMAVIKEAQALHDDYYAKYNKQFEIVNKLVNEMRGWCSHNIGRIVDSVQKHDLYYPSIWGYGNYITVSFVAPLGEILVSPKWETFKECNEYCSFISFVYLNPEDDYDSAKTKIDLLINEILDMRLEYIDTHRCNMEMAGKVASVFAGELNKITAHHRYCMYTPYIHNYGHVITLQFFAPIEDDNIPDYYDKEVNGDIYNCCDYIYVDSCEYNNVFERVSQSVDLIKRLHDEYYGKYASSCEIAHTLVEDFDKHKRRGCITFTPGFRWVGNKIEISFCTPTGIVIPSKYQMQGRYYSDIYTHWISVDEDDTLETARGKVDAICNEIFDIEKSYKEEYCERIQIATEALKLIKWTGNNEN